MSSVLLIFILLPTSFTVERVTFHGNNTFSSKDLKKIIKTREGEIYDEFQANLDGKRLINFYKSKGFEKMEVVEWERYIVDFELKLVRCDIYIEEGTRTYMEKYSFEGNDIFSSQQLKRVIKLAEGDPLDENLIFIAEYNLVTFYNNKGYAYAEVRHSVTPIDSYKVSLCFHIEEHQLVRFGGPIIKGNEFTRDRIVMREITFKKGDTYSLQKLYESQARIYGTDLFESVKFDLEGVKESKDTLNVVFCLKEKPPHWAAVGAGYGSPDRVWFNTGWGHDNLWNNGQRLELQVRYELNPFDLRNLQIFEVDIFYSEPYLLNTAFKAQLRPFYNLYRVRERDEETGYRLAHTGVEGRLGRYIGRFGESFVSYNYEIVHKKGIIPGEEGGIVNSFLYSFSWDTRNDVFYPRKGGISSVSYEYAGGLLGGDYRFDKFTFDFALYAPFFRSVVSGRLKFGGITGDAPLKRKFILGGVNTIRGYVDMLYASVYEGDNWIALINLEMRNPLFWGFELAYFIDAGNTWVKKKDIRIADIKIGAGFGLRYYTPIGPLRVDYGRKLIDPGRDRGRPYIAIGYMF